MAVTEADMMLCHLYIILLQTVQDQAGNDCVRTYLQTLSTKMPFEDFDDHQLCLTRVCVFCKDDLHAKCRMYAQMHV